MPDEKHLVQTRIPTAAHRKLVAAQKRAGFTSLSEYLRTIITAHLRQEETHERKTNRRKQ